MDSAELDLWGGGERVWPLFLAEETGVWDLDRVGVRDLAMLACNTVRRMKPLQRIEFEHIRMRI